MSYQDKTFEEISKEVEALIHIDSNDLDRESLRGVKIFPAISAIYTEKSRQLYALTVQLNKLLMARKKHYGGKETSEHYKKEPLPVAILKQDIDDHIDIDPLVIEMRKMVKEVEMTVKFLEEAKGQLRQRGFDIKNAIDFRRMMLGA